MTQYSQVDALAQLLARITRVVGGSLHLGKGDAGIIGPDKVAADYAAQECDFDGYAAIDPIPAALDPYQDGANRVSQQIPTQQFNFVLAGGTTNIVTFAWIETAANAIVQAFAFPGEGIPMDSNLSALPIDLKFSEVYQPIP